MCIGIESGVQLIFEELKIIRIAMASTHTTSSHIGSSMAARKLETLEEHHMKLSFDEVHTKL